MHSLYQWGIGEHARAAHYLEGFVQVIPNPVSLEDLNDGAARLQEGRVGQI